MNLIRSITTIGGFTMGSRILGFVRDILIAAYLGAGPIADAFFVAFKFPNLFRRLFAEGAFNAAFVPLFSGKLESEGQDEAKKFADMSFAVLLWALFVFTLVIELAMPWVMRIFAPGFLNMPEKFDLTVFLTRITFPYLFFVSGVSLMAGVLNSLEKFAAAAATPILLNLCLIGAIICVTPFLPTPGHALAWGVAIAGLIQFFWLFWHCGKAGIWMRLSWPHLSSDVRLLIRRIIPGAVGAGVYQLNLTIDMVIASLLPSGSISFLFYADRVTQLPLGIVGVATGTALLPLLSRHLRAGKIDSAIHDQNRALEFSFLLTLPAAIALAIVAIPIIDVLFQRGAFTMEDVNQTAAALTIYACGLPAYVLIKSLTPGFFSREDTKTPVKIAALCMVVNLGLNLLLMEPFLHVGIAMATIISSWLNAALLAILLKRRGALIPDKRLKSRLFRIILAGIGMGGALYSLQIPLISWLSESQIERIFALIILIVAGFVIFIFLALLLKAVRLSDLQSLTSRV